MGLPAHTLTEEDVIVIWTTMQSEQELADIYGISVQMVHKIKTGELYRHITKDVVGGGYYVNHNRGQFIPKLTEQQVLEIYNSDKSITEFSIKFNVSPSVIYDVRRGKTWRHLLYLRKKPHRQLRSKKIKGSKNPYRLTEQDVNHIMTLLPIMRNRDIAKMYQVHPSTISSIRHGKNWKHITQGQKFPKSKISELISCPL